MSFTLNGPCSIGIWKLPNKNKLFIFGEYHINPDEQPCEPPSVLITEYIESLPSGIMLVESIDCRGEIMCDPSQKTMFSLLESLKQHNKHKVMSIDPRQLLSWTIADSIIAIGREVKRMRRTNKQLVETMTAYLIDMFNPDPYGKVYAGIYDYQKLSILPLEQEEKDDFSVYYTGTRLKTVSGTERDEEILAFCLDNQPEYTYPPTLQLFYDSLVNAYEKQDHTAMRTEIADFTSVFDKNTLSRLFDVSLAPVMDFNVLQILTNVLENVKNTQNVMLYVGHTHMNVYRKFLHTPLYEEDNCETDESHCVRVRPEGQTTTGFWDGCSLM